MKLFDLRCGRVLVLVATSVAVGALGAQKSTELDSKRNAKPTAKAKSAKQEQSATEQGSKASPSESPSEFLARVRPILRTAKAPGKIDAFTTRVAVQIHTRKLEADIAARIDFSFPRYLRTEVREGKKTITRGRGKGLVPWQDDGKRSYLLSGKERAQDRANVARDLAIAAGMTRYLYPDRLLGELVDLAGPTPTTIKWMRGKAIDTYRLTGIARDGSEFPLAASPDHEGPIRISMWFRKADLYPVALRLEPLDNLNRRKPAGRAEELRFLAHRRHAELLMPAKILFRIATRSGKLKTTQTLVLKSFEANPKFDAKHFARPKR